MALFLYLFFKTLMWLDWLGQFQVKLSIYYTFAYFIRTYLVNQQMQMTRRKRFLLFPWFQSICYAKIEMWSKSATLSRQQAAQCLGESVFGHSQLVGRGFFSLFFWLVVVTPNVTEVCHRLNEDHALWTIWKSKWKQTWKKAAHFCSNQK